MVFDDDAVDENTGKDDDGEDGDDADVGDDGDDDDDGDYGDDADVEVDRCPIPLPSYPGHSWQLGNLTNINHI